MAIGTITEDAAVTVDADGLVVAPGFVDPHTHYDAQLFWDPAASPSNLHGVTSVIAGNCGFTLAPARARGRRLPAPHDGEGRRHAAARARDRRAVGLAVVRRLPRRARRQRRAERRLPRRPLRAAPQRDGHRRDRRRGDARRSSTRWSACCTTRSRRAASASRPRSRSRTPTATASRSRRAGRRRTKCSRSATRSRTTRAPRSSTSPTAACRGFSDDEVEMMAEMTLAGRRPLNWNVLTIDSREPERYHEQLAACENAFARGGKAVALTMPVLVEMNMSFRNYCALFMLPGWNEVMNLPVPERIAKLKDPSVRQWMNERARCAGSRRVLPARLVGPLHDRRHVLRGQRGPEGAGDRRDRRAREPRHLRHAARHRHQRRPADDPVAAALRQRLEVVADASRGVGAPARDDRRFRRRRAPRPDVRRAVHDVVPRRHVARAAVGVARTVRAADDADARAALRAPRPRRGARGLPRRSSSASIPRPSPPAR